MDEKYYNLSKIFISHCLKNNINDVENIIRDNISLIRKDLDMSAMDDRKNLYEYITHLKLLFLNISLNGEMYFYGQKESDLSNKSIKVLSTIIKEMCLPY